MEPALRPASTIPKALRWMRQDDALRCGYEQPDESAASTRPRRRDDAGRPGEHTGLRDGVGSAARFNRPYGMATDAAGTMVYVADREENTIRSIVVATQTVSTLAGQHGVEGLTDGIGTAARLRRPTDVACDASGATVYVADSWNNVLRAINTATQAVSTVAGAASAGTADGVGSAARFHTDSGVAADASGAVVFVADTANNTIRRFDAATRAVTTVAGVAAESGAADGTGSAARFNWPSGIAVDGAGTTAYVADWGNSTIRRIQLASGVVTTLAGTTGAGGVCRRNRERSALRCSREGSRERRRDHGVCC